MVNHGEEFSAERKTAYGKSKAEARQCQKIERIFPCCSGTFGIRRNYEEPAKKIGIAHGVSYAMKVAKDLRKHNLEDVKGISTRAAMR